MPFSPLLFAGDRLTLAELCAARLDGDVVELGEAFLPADAPETAELRARSLAPLLIPAVALTHSSAAWIYGAIAEAPARHWLQRAVPWRPHQRWSRRFLYRDAALEAADVHTVGGVALTSPTRTVIDLLRRAGPGDREVAWTLLCREPEIASGARAWIARHPRHAGLSTARRGLAAWDDAQEEVTRYTS